MWWPFQWVVIYVLGGLTFVPLVVVAAIWYALTYGSVPIGDLDPTKIDKAELQQHHERAEMLEKSKAATGKPLSGWLTVRRQFQPTNTSTSIFMPNMSNPEASPTESTSGEEIPTEKDDASIKSGTSTPLPANGSTPAAPTTYSARIAQTYRQMVEARQKNNTPPKEFFFCVLKGQVLFLYEDEAQSECVAAIGVDKYAVGMEGKEGKAFTGKDAEMFAKRNAIVMRIAERDGEEMQGLPALSKDMAVTEEDKEVAMEKEHAPWYLFAKSNTKMEDWYLALTSASAARPTIDNVFSERDMQALVDTIDTEPDPIPMRWLNAMLGRIFFGLYRTEALEQFIIAKIMKKLSKVPRPSFLGPIVIREVNVGTFPPILSKPMLKDLTADGAASFEVHLNYRSRPNQPNSEVRVTIATTATIPTGFKPYVVDLVLAVVLKSMEGNLVMQIKKPPSNRFWYGFTSMPKMEVEIQPIVSERKIQIGMVLKAIEKQLREVIAESIVLPNMDDIAFFDTSTLDIRGGIFSSAGKVARKPTTDILAGGDEMATQPGVNVSGVIDTSAPSTVDSSGLRKRVTKAQTMDVVGRGTNPASESTETEGVGTSVPAAKKAASINVPKKWFANGRPASITSLGAISLTSDAKDSADKPRSASTERSHIDSLPAAASAEEASASMPDLPRKSGESGGALDGKNEGSKQIPIIQQDPATASVDTLTSTNTVTPAGERAQAASPGESTLSTASLITSLRARDKKAVQAQVTGARDAVKKWGVNWAAKRRTNLAGGLDETEARPAPMYRPPDEDDLGSGSSDQGLSRSAEGPKTLQDRLNAAAAVANRPKSGSVSSTSPIPAASRPILQSSPASKASAGSFGTSPPQWTLSAAAPTTGVAHAEVAARPGVGGPTPPRPRSPTKGPHERRGSTSNPVFQQPSAGRSMVVPRVPKRPGQVVGIGSSEMGITRRISGSDVDTERMDGKEVGKVAPVLPPRKSMERDETGGDVLPPKLPARKASPQPPAATTSDNTALNGPVGADPAVAPDVVGRTVPDVVAQSQPAQAPASTMTPDLPLRPKSDIIGGQPPQVADTGTIVTSAPPMPESAAPIAHLLHHPIHDAQVEAHEELAKDNVPEPVVPGQGADVTPAEGMLRDLVRRGSGRDGSEGGQGGLNGNV